MFFPGTLHLVDSPFLRPSKNKLTIASNDLTNHINKSTFYLADESAGARGKALRTDANALPAAFLKWLRDRHDKYDREVEIDDSQGVRKPDGVHFSEFSFFDSDQRYTLKAGATIALHKKGKHAEHFGKLLSYVTPLKDPSSSAGAHVLYEQLPFEAFGSEVRKAALPLLDLHQSANQEQAKKNAEIAGLAVRRGLPHVLKVVFKGKDERKKIASGESYPAGNRFAQQGVRLFGFGDKAPELRGNAAVPLTVLRGVFRKFSADSQRKPPKSGDCIAHLQTAAYGVEFYRPVSTGYKQCPVTESKDTSFDEFTISDAGDYLIEFFLKERNMLSKRIEFTVLAGPPVKLEFVPAPPVVQCALGSWASNALQVQFRDAHGNLCAGARDMMDQFTFSVEKVGKVSGALKSLEFFVRKGAAHQTKGAAAATSRAHSAAASASAAAPPSPPSSLDPLSLNLLVSLLEGHEVSVPAELSPALKLTPRVGGKQSAAPATMQAPFVVNIVAGEPAGWQWMEPEVDDEDADIPTVEVENGAPMERPLQVVLIDSARNRVTLGAGQSFQAHLRVVNPLQCLFGDLIANGLTVPVDSEGVARFNGILLSVHPQYFAHSQLPFVDVELLVELQGTTRAAISSPIHVRVNATTAPRAIRVMLPQPEGAVARQPPRRATAAVTSLAAAASSSVVSPSSAPGPVILSAAVDCEFPLYFALFDEANRPVSLASLQHEYKMQQAVARRAALPQTADADDDSEMLNTFLGLDDGDNTDNASGSAAAAAAGSPAAAAAAGKRKRSATYKAAANLSSLKRRMHATGAINGQVLESEIVVKGLSGVSRFPLSALTTDSVLHGVRMPAKVPAPIEASLRMSWPQAAATYTCDFVVQPIYDAAVEMRCAVIAEPAADEPFGPALKLQFEDKHGNVVPPPHQAELRVQLQRVDATQSTSEEGDAAAAIASASASSDAVSACECFTVVLGGTPAVDSNPLSALQLKHSRAGTWEVSLSVPSLPHLTALAHLRIHGGTVESLRFITVSAADATPALLLHTPTRSYLPAFRILACDALGNICPLDADVVLKSALFSQRKLVMRSGECLVAGHSQLVKYSEAGALLPIDIVCSPIVEGAVAGSAATKKRKAPKSKSDLRGQVLVKTEPTRKFVVGITRREDKGTTHNARGEAAAAAAASASASSPLLHVGCGWPSIHVDVRFQSADDALEEIDLEKFSLTTHAVNKNKAASATHAGSNAASASSLDFSYPTPTIAPVSGGCTLVFSAAASDVVRMSGEYTFDVQFKETSPTLAAVLTPADTKRQCSFLLTAQAGAPASVRCAYTLVPASANSSEPRQIATGVSFRVLDECANVIPLKQLLTQWPAPKWA